MSVSPAEHMARFKVLAIISEFRSQVGRLFFFLILRTMARDDRERGFYAELSRVAKARIEFAAAASSGRDPVEGCDEAALNWARAHVAAVPGVAEKIRAFYLLICQAEETAGTAPDGLVEFLLDITGEADTLFGGSFAALLQEMEDELSMSEASRAAASDAATEDAQAAMARIDAISRSVRLISLNAAVEAARVGDAGRGFSVISGEIKTLAEAIASASQEAAKSMDNLKKLAGG